MLGSLWRFAVRTAAGAVALWVVIKLIDGSLPSFPTTPLYQDGQHDNLLTFLAVAAIIVVLNATVKPVLKLLGLPLTIITLGLFSLVINAVIMLLAEYVSDLIGFGLHIETFGAAFWGAIVLALVNWVLGPITGLLGAKKD